jgi:uncharacterized protein YwqG
MSVKLSFSKGHGDLFGQSKWWGFPDMPDSLEYPMIEIEEDGETYSDPLTFICQIRCSDIAPFDQEGLLPHEGMLYFFAYLDYFLGDFDAYCPGSSEWDKDCFKVLYSHDCNDLHHHSVLYDDGTEACLPPERIIFAEGSHSDGFRLSGKPYMSEIADEYPDMESLLQVDEDDDWGLRFFDCGMLNFLIKRKDLQSLRFEKTVCVMCSS